MGLNLDRDRLCLLQFSDETGDTYLVKFSNDYSAPNLRKLLSDSSREFIFHYARFDLAIIQKYLEVDIKKVFCTKVASRIIRTYTDLHGLKELCRELLGIQLSKQQQTSDWGAEELTKDQRIYAARDVIYLHQIREKLIEMLKRERRYELFQETCSFLSCRAKLDLLGWNNFDIFAH